MRPVTRRLAICLLLASCGDAPATSPSDAGFDALPDTVVAFDGSIEPELPYVPTGDAPPWDPAACDLRWTYTRPEGGLPSSLAVDAKGNVYAAGAGRLHRIKPAGTFDWTWPPSASELAMPGEQLTGAAINAYGTTLVVAGETGRVYAITHLGGTKWTWDAGAPIRSTPALGEETLPLAPQGGFVAAVDDDGRLWVLRDEGSQAVLAAMALDVGAPGPVPPTITILDDGMLFVRTAGRLTAASPQGVIGWAWSAAEGDALVAGPAVASDGTLRVVVGHGATPGGQYEGFGVGTWTPAGELIVERPTDLANDMVVGLALGPADEVVLTAGTRVQSWTPGGQLLWRVFGDFVPASPPSLAAGDLTVVGASPHAVILVDENGEIHWRHELDGELAAGAPVVGDDGTTYLHLGSSVVALHCGAPGPAPSRWPRHQGTARNAGRPAPTPAAP